MGHNMRVPRNEENTVCPDDDDDALLLPRGRVITPQCGLPRMYKCFTKGEHPTYKGCVVGFEWPMSETGPLGVKPSALS